MTNIYHGDCMEAMRGMPDKAYDIAIVDPPYGLGGKITRGGSWSGGIAKAHGASQLDDGYEWDVPPPPEYFQELRRVSKHQIVWGANYFEGLPPSRGVIAWDKGSQFTSGQSFAEFEYAWTSFDVNAKIARVNHLTGFRKLTEGGNLHPTQKPVALYKWLLTQYVQDGWRILDTHGGSCSIAIAVHDMAHRNLSLDVWELNELYHGRAVKRLADHQAQLRIAL